MNSDKTKVKIDRAKWCCGGADGEFINGKGQTKLLNCEGYMCCLGFVTAAANPELSILERAELVELKAPVSGLTYPDASMVWKGWRNTQLTLVAMAINDSGLLQPQEWEARLLELFEDSRYELEFVGEYEAKEDLK
jgi:hypothetical protein